MTGKADNINLFSFQGAPMRAFHLTWVAFFICFFAWFACAPLMPVIKGEFGLSMEQIANINIAAVAITIFVRLLVGPLCDRYGPRKTYTGLLLIGAIPVLGVAMAQSYETFLLARLGIGAVGASFVITQYHTSVMFSPKVVGTANAAAAGWGNAGGGAAQALMPLLLTAVVMLGVSQSMSWRVALVVPGVMMIVMAFVYWRYTQDCPAGNYDDLRKTGNLPASAGKGGWASFTEGCRNHRAWLLFVTYGACFGIEIFIHNIAAVYYVDHFDLTLGQAGMAAGSFGLLALFARALGGWLSDRAARSGDVNRRVTILFVLMIGEALGLLWFAQADGVVFAVVAMLVFGLFTHMACGATYALVPFVAPKALGGVAGIVGAGGNVGAVAAGFLMKGTGDIQSTLTILSGLVLVASLCALGARFGSTSRIPSSTPSATVAA
jgi:NNP family nitrate/nitrite transporter-like MFS transporter